jgi:hypothetical protein
LGSGAAVRLAFRLRPDGAEGNIHQYIRNRQESPSNIKSMPVFHDGRLYVTVGGDIWWGKRKAWLQCISTTGTGDITDTGLVWSYEIDRHCCSTPAIHDGLAYFGDCAGRVHCVDIRTGQAVWVHDAEHEIWSSPLGRRWQGLHRHAARHLVGPGRRARTASHQFPPAARPHPQLGCGSQRHPVRGHHVDTVRVHLAAFWQEDLESLIAVLAHYAALDRLLRDGIMQGDEPDLGWYADLACVFVGMGIFGANSAMKQRSGGDGIGTGWQIRARHPLPARVFGYAMALAAMARGERQAPWAAWLGDDAIGRRTSAGCGSCSGGANAFSTMKRTGRCASPPACLRWLRIWHGGDSTRLASLWALREHGSAAAPALDEIAACLRSSSRVLQSEAARVIGAIGVETPAVSATN